MSRHPQNDGTKGSLKWIQKLINDNPHLLNSEITSVFKSTDFEVIEWGHDDYSLEIKNLPKAPPEPPACALHADREEQTEDTPAKPRRKFGKGNPAQTTLFDFMEGGPGDE